MAPDRTRRTRRSFLQGGLALAGLGLVVGCGQVSLPWQRPGKVYRVGILGESASDSTEARLHQALGLGLQERGWIEGENLLTEFRWTEGNAARIPDLAADLVRLPVDLILEARPTTGHVERDRPRCERPIT